MYADFTVENTTLCYARVENFNIFKVSEQESWKHCCGVDVKRKFREREIRKICFHKSRLPIKHVDLDLLSTSSFSSFPPSPFKAFEKVEFFQLVRHLFHTEKIADNVNWARYLKQLAKAILLKIDIPYVIAWRWKIYVIFFLCINEQNFQLQYSNEKTFQRTK